MSGLHFSSSQFPATQSSTFPCLHCGIAIRLTNPIPGEVLEPYTDLRLPLSLSQGNPNFLTSRLIRCPTSRIVLMINRSLCPIIPINLHSSEKAPTFGPKASHMYAFKTKALKAIINSASPKETSSKSKIGTLQVFSSRVSVTMPPLFSWM